MHFIFLAIFSLLGPSVFASGSSFEDLKSMVYESPLRTLPQHQGLSKWDVISNLLGSEEKPSHGLSIRSRRILVDESDIRDTDEPKWLHPRGACAEAKWIITENNPATGLFENGVVAPALLRISTGDKVSEYTTDGRIFGLAVKVFPGAPNQKVKTANFIGLDQDGFDRSARRHVFFGDDHNDQIYFTNVAPAKSALGKFLSTFFDRFDQPNFARPVYSFSRSRFGGGELTHSSTPYEIRFIPDESMNRPTKNFSDFRLELLEKRKRVLKIVLESFDGKSKLSKTIGRLELGDFVVSDFCDLGLHFHHSPIEDQWEKYYHYDVVNDLR